MAVNPLHATVINAFRDRLTSLGINPLEVIQIASQDRNVRPTAQSPTVHEILETAVAMSGDTALAIKIGNGLNLAGHGTYGFALMSCSDMGAALDFFLRYGQTFIQSSCWHRSIREDGITLRFQQSAGTSYQKMLVTELAFSQLHMQSKLLVAKPAEGIRIHFCYAKPPHFGAYEQNWPLPMKFDQKHTQIFIPDQWLQQRIRTGDPTTNVLFTQQCEELVSRMSQVDKTAATVRRLLIHSAGRFLNIVEVAEQLNITERTLRRRLTAEGTDFRSIFDDIKNTLAQNYLRKTSLSVVEIADLLNYAESTNFHRAFKRWNSITPADYRRHVST